MYVVQLLRKEIIVSVGIQSPLSRKQTVKLSYAEGMIGALPVFDTYENALTYAKEEHLILEIEG